MGGLAHYFEEDGLATTQISLIRVHTETIKPPRALWVSFDLGRPLGEPNDPKFQTRVLKAALDLLDEPAGPVLIDFPEDAAYMADSGPWACPVSFDTADEDLSQEEKLITVFKKEMNSLRNWYDIAIKERGRTTVNASGISVEKLPDFLTDILLGKEPENPNPAYPLPHTLNLATDDLKAFYFEAVIAQPGGIGSPTQLADWFYQETAAAKMLYAIRDKAATSEDGFMKIVAGALIIPGDRAKAPE